MSIDSFLDIFLKPLIVFKDIFSSSSSREMFSVVMNVRLKKRCNPYRAIIRLGLCPFQIQHNYTSCLDQLKYATLINILALFSTSKKYPAFISGIAQKTNYSKTKSNFFEKHRLTRFTDALQMMDFRISSEFSAD